MDVISVQENYKPKRFHNIIVNVFDLILYYTLILLPRALFQLEPKLLLGVDALVQSQVGIPVIVKTILLSSMVRSLILLKVHLSPASSFSDSLHSFRNALYILIYAPLRRLCV